MGGSTVHNLHVCSEPPRTIEGEAPRPRIDYVVINSNVVDSKCYIQYYRLE